MRSLCHPLVEGFCAACKPADRRPPWEWCEEHVQVTPFPEDQTEPADFYVTPTKMVKVPMMHTDHA